MGAQAKAVQRYLGHARPRTTFDVYGHLTPDADAKLTSRSPPPVGLTSTDLFEARNPSLATR